jgi:protein-tyrosine kinase
VSLVEQAIARLKHQQGRTAKVGSAEAPKSAPRRPMPDALEDTSSLAQQLTVNYAALRAAGYLPEPDVERQFADHYRRIKRPLVDKAMSGAPSVGEPRAILVTSALPGDGKTFTSINLALSMALERDVSVLLIDADVARQHLSQIFGLQEQTGLLDALVNDRLDAESAIVPTTTRGLSILPAGRRVPNTAELLSSNRMRTIVTSLCARNSRRILLLDSAPLLLTNEGRFLIKFVGQVVLVVRAGETPRHAVQAALELFDTQQAGGIVLTDVQGSSTSGYYGYGSYGNDAAQT